MRGRFWSNVTAVAYRETTVLRHDQALLGMIFVQPIVQLLLLGFALSTKPTNVPWAVLDRSDTAASRRLVREFEATGSFLSPRSLGSEAEGVDLLTHGAALAVLVIPSGFARADARGDGRCVQLMVDGSDPLSSSRLLASMSLVAAASAPQASTYELERPDRRGQTPGTIDVRQRFLFNPTLSDRNFYLASLAAMILTNLAFSVTALGLVAERESGAYEQMLASPTSSVEIVIGKLLPYVAVSYVVLLLSTLAPGLFFGFWPSGSWLALVAVTLPFVLASLAVGVFVSVLARTSEQAVFITTFFIMPSLLLSGTMLPYQLTPHPLREIGAIFPLRWYQIALRQIIERGAGLPEVAVSVVALVGLFGAFLFMAHSRMKPRL